jgi:AbrB family looped-hinge helix DNA binding protein
MNMALRNTVKVSKRYQIVIPHAAREQLNIQSGDRLLVDIQDGMIILSLKPENYTNHLMGMHKEIWERIDPNEYLETERQAWEKSTND